MSTMDSKLYKAAKFGHIHLLVQLLNENPGLLTKVTPQQNTTLHIAAQFGHKSAVLEIYGRCRSLLTRSNLNGDTPLHVAARCGHCSVVDLLVKELLSTSSLDTETGQNDNFEMLRLGNRENNTILHEAVRTGHLCVVELLLKIDPMLACYENHAGESPLYLAARQGMKDILNQILRSAPYSAHGGSDGQTALHAAVIERHSDVMEILLQAKAQLVAVADHQGRTPLHYAASLGNCKTVEKLLELDASTAYVLDENGLSPLHIAAKNGHINIIKQIVCHCPDSGELLDLKGRNAFHFAALNGKVNVVRRMLEIAELEGLINQADNAGNTPLHLAFIERQTSIARYLMWDERVNQRPRDMINIERQSVFDIDKSVRDSCFTFHRNIVTRVWSKKEPSSKDQEAISATQAYQQMGNTLLMVTTLIATVTFTAAFTMPGGFNNNVGLKQGVALLQSSKYLEWFIVSDAVAMTSSMVSACLIFCGAICSNEHSYVYYLATATMLTCIALQSTAMAFTSGMIAVLPDKRFAGSLADAVGIAFHFINFLFLVQLVRIFLASAICQFLIFCFCNIKSKIDRQRKRYNSQ